MSDIFISYAKEDQDRVEPLVTLLESAGWSVWWDPHIDVGRSFDEVIEKEIAAAKCVMVVWSEFSVTSRWVKTEAAEGNERGILAPILLDSVTLPLEFRRIETADLTDWQGGKQHRELANLLSSIAGILQRPVPNLKEPAPKNVPKKTSKRMLIGSLVAAVVLVGVYGLYVSFDSKPRTTTANTTPVRVDPTSNAGSSPQDPEEIILERSSGTACITPSTLFDLDDGQWNAGAGNADLFFRNQDGVVRSLDARQSAFHPLGSRNFAKVTYDSIKGLDFDTRSLDATIGIANDVEPGTVFAVRTSDQRYAKVQILKYGTYMQFKWATYGTKADGPVVTETKSAPCSREEAKQCGAGQLSGDKISSFTVPSASRDELTVGVSYGINRSHGRVYLGASLLDENNDALNRGFRPTLAPQAGQTQTKITVSRPGRSNTLFVWLYEKNKAEAFVCRRFPYQKYWGE